jgi:hypothetical protein
MAAKRGIRLRISHQRIEALQEICDEMLEEFIARNEHQHLLREYLADLRQLLRDMICRRQEIYTLILGGAESIAFYQLWNMMDISRDKYATLVVNNLLDRLSIISA